MRSLIFLSSLIFLFSSCSILEKKTEATAKVTNETGSFIDSRDNRKYITVKIGEQWWMAENLDFNSEDSWYYKNTPRNASFFGRLYTFESAKNSCPAGWHLPTDDEWMKLELSLGMPEKALDESEFRGIDQGTKLMAKGSSGFNAMYSGFRSTNGEFDEMDITGIYWTATGLGKFDAWCRALNIENGQISRRTFGKTYGFSVRCVQDKVEKQE